MGTEHEINQVLNHKHLGNGSIILFHNDAKFTPQALDTIIKGLKDKGFEIVPISEIIIRVQLVSKKLSHSLFLDDFCTVWSLYLTRHSQL